MTNEAFHSFETTGAQIKAVSKWKYYALHHELTELPNRRMLHMSMRPHMERAIRANESLGIVYLNINKFKEINNFFGRIAGDSFLIEVGRRLVDLSVHHIHAFHLSGDDFVLLIEKGNQLSDQIALIESIFDQPFLLKNMQILIGASLGISLFPDQSVYVDELFQFADEALHRAKSSVDHHCCIYSKK